MSQEDASFVLFLVFKLEDEIESRDFLLDLLIVAPSDFVEILSFDEACNDTLTKFSFSAWEIPLAKTDSFSSSRISVLFNYFLSNLDVEKRIKCFNWKESPVTITTLSFSSETLFNLLLEVSSFKGFLSNVA